jgi:hypothetical protein
MPASAAVPDAIIIQVTAVSTSSFDVSEQGNANFEFPISIRAKCIWRILYLSASSEKLSKPNLRSSFFSSLLNYWINS